MIDFNSLVTRDRSEKESDPRLLFKSLSKSNGINDLYEIQSNALDEWYKRRDEKDLVIKMPTGSGKTLVGLLAAKASANELSSGALYLVENKQLVDQVITQAKKVGIKAIAYAGRESLGADFNNGEVIVVGSYQALFNGKSTFGIDGYTHTVINNVGTIILDDAHASLSAIRDACSIKLLSTEPLYKEITSLFMHSFNSIGLSETYNDTINGGAGIAESSVMEIPVSEWYKNLGDVQKLLASNREESDSLIFGWPLLKDRLCYCRCVVSRASVTIAPYLPLTDSFLAFKEANRRIYMSATFADDSAMLKTFNMPKEVVSKPIHPLSYSGIGKRMILSVLKEMNEERLAQLIKQIRENGGTPNILIESPSRKEAEKWEKWFPIATGETIEDEIQSLICEKSSSKTIVTVNRYNGIDLPDDACRLIILHGLPYGRSDLDLLDEKQLSSSEVYVRMIAEKIEQGMGRGTRGASDYCVVLLHGYDLQKWIGTKKYAKYLTAATRAQIEVGDTIFEGIKESEEEYIGAICQGIKGDQGFLNYCANETESISQRYSDPKSSDSILSLSKTMRDAWNAWLDQRPSEAINEIKKVTKALCDEEPSFYGLLLQMAGAIAWSNGDERDSREFQNEAHKLNRNLYSVGEITDDTEEGLENTIKSINTPTVFLEGETDEKYFIRAADTFGINVPFEFRWVGHKDDSRQAKSTGCEELKKIVSVLRNQKDLANRKIAVIFDCDVKGVEESDKNNVLVLLLKEYENSKGIKKGIENTLILDDLDEHELRQFYHKHCRVDEYSGKHSNEEFDKVKFCEFICSKEDSELRKVFKNLRSIIDKLVKYFS